MPSLPVLALPVLDQADYDLRFDVGPSAARRLAPASDAVIVVDVLTFSTAVTVATARDAVVYPFPFGTDARRDRDRPEDYAESLGALCAGRRGKSRYSLSPPTLAQLAAGERIVLPSPNGATVSLATAVRPTFVACLRNAKAAAEAAQAVGRRILVIACGERWQQDDSLRYAFEDQLGAGAVLSFLSGRLSPEAAAALAVYRDSARELAERLFGCASARELIARGFRCDVDYAAELNGDAVAPRLQRDAAGHWVYRADETTPSGAPS